MALLNQDQIQHAPIYFSWTLYEIIGIGGNTSVCMRPFCIIVKSMDNQEYDISGYKNIVAVPSAIGGRETIVHPA